MIKSAATFAASVYPAYFPQPLRVNYTGSQAYPMAVTKMADGHSKRRLMMPFKLVSLNMTFRMEQPTFVDWHNWVHAYGFDWFSMQIQDETVTATAEPFLAIASVRFTGAAQWNLNDWGWMDVNISAERSLKGVSR